jgi:hypothetical protein
VPHSAAEFRVPLCATISLAVKEMINHLPGRAVGSTGHGAAGKALAAVGEMVQPTLLLEPTPSREEETLCLCALGVHSSALLCTGELALTKVLLVGRLDGFFLEE